MELRKLHPDFGVEIIGFDVENGRDSADVEALRAAYDQHSLLLIRCDTRLSKERHLGIARWFGPPPPLDNSGEGDFVTVHSNADASGTIELKFHSDQAYTEEPIAGISLQAIELPPGGTSTSFVSGIAAWRHLPDVLKAELEHTTLRHRLDMSISGLDWPPFEAEHPVRLAHPRTGEPVLFVTEHHADRILELSEDRSAEVLAELMTHLYAPERRFEHRWQLHDLLIFDNIALQHARTRVADRGEGARSLQRVALAETPLDEHIAHARARTAA